MDFAWCQAETRWSGPITRYLSTMGGGANALENLQLVCEGETKRPLHTYVEQLQRHF